MRVFVGFNITGPTRLLDVVDALVQTGNEYLTSESLVLRHLRTTGQKMPAGIGCTHTMPQKVGQERS